INTPKNRGEYLGIDPFYKASLQGGSYDLHLGDEIVVNGDKFLVSTNTWLIPGKPILASTFENVVIPYDCAAQIVGKSSIGRRFVQVTYAGWIDPGFRGNITIQLANHDPWNAFQLKIGMPICQIVFFKMDNPANYQYAGKYQGAQGVEGA